MPDKPFPLTGQNTDQLVNSLMRIINDLFDSSIGAARVGDVFEIDASNDDVLTLKLADAGGLEKSSGTLQIMLNATSPGLTLSSSGISVKVRASYGINLDANGLALKKQDHEAAAAAVSAISAGAGADSIDRAAFNTALGTLVTEINAIKTTLNNLLAKLETAEILKTS
jgi:hypothetical protein